MLNLLHYSVIKRTQALRLKFSEWRQRNNNVKKKAVSCGLCEFIAGFNSIMNRYCLLKRVIRIRIRIIIGKYYWFKFFLFHYTRLGSQSIFSNTLVQINNLLTILYIQNIGALFIIKYKIEKIFVIFWTWRIKNYTTSNTYYLQNK